MASLNGNKIKDTYQSLLKLATGSLTSTYKTIEDGSGNDAGMKLSTTGVEVGELKFTTAPTTSSSDLTALVYDDATNTVKKRTLSSSAFSGAATPATLIARTPADLVIESGYTTPQYQDINNTDPDLSYQFGNIADLTLSPSGTVTINTSGVYRLVVSAIITTSSSNLTLTYNISVDGSPLVEPQRSKSASGTFLDTVCYTQYFVAGQVVSFSVRSSGGGATLNARSMFDVMQLG